LNQDSFIGQYINLLNQEIADRRVILEDKDFVEKSDFTKIQGQLQGLKTALNLLKAIPEED
jgi:hypothetical protein